MDAEDTTEWKDFLGERTRRTNWSSTPGVAAAAVVGDPRTRRAIVRKNRKRSRCLPSARKSNNEDGEWLGSFGDPLARKLERGEWLNG